MTGDVIRSGRSLAANGGSGPGSAEASPARWIHSKTLVRDE